MVDGTTAAMAPSAVSLASTWDTEIISQLGSLLATEMRDKKADILLAPTGAFDPKLRLPEFVANLLFFQCACTGRLWAAEILSLSLAMTPSLEESLRQPT
jgi:hypothetical protein